MAEYIFLSTYQNHPVRVRMGWSRCLQRYYVLVEYTTRNAVPIYSHDEDPDVSRYTDLGYFVKKLIGLGLSVPKAAVRGLISAPLRDGTAVNAHGALRVMQGNWKKPLAREHQSVARISNRPDGSDGAPSTRVRGKKFIE
ncbi:hypothetical protein [Ralstonia psammae]|nr:hypothetical protein [Ralstonia sp. LMG 19083]